MATVDISQLVVEVKSKGILTAVNQLDRLTDKADKAEKAVKRLGTSVIGANSAMNLGAGTTAALIAAMTTLTAVLQRQTSQTQRVTRVQRQHNESMREAHALARGLSGSLGALWMTYGNITGMAVGVAIGAALKGVLEVGKDVEHTLEQIRVLGGASTQEIEKMRDAVYSLGQGVNGPQDVAEALKVLTLAGLKANEAMQGVGASLNLAIAGDISIEKSASTLVQVSTALGYTAADFDHLADVVAKTAATSMSSVESISGAFKSAAAVGEVYGATLQDIGIGLAAVANLGIQGTAAGTALKNFYADLAKNGDKAAKTFAAMGLSLKDLKGKDGYFLKLTDVVAKLDDGLAKLADRQAGLNNLFGERGIKVAAALVKLRNTASSEFDAMGRQYKNKLEEMEDAINKSAAFSTLAAIAMSQTTTNQLKSVANTLKTTFARAFTEVSPQIGEVARALKKAFSSPEFLEGLKALITNIADLTKFIVEHIKVIGYVVATYAGWKVLEFVTGIVKMAQAFQFASIAAAGFTVALGPIAVAIAAMGAAWLIFKANQDKALDNDRGQSGLSAYTEEVLKAAEKEQEILRLRKEGKTEEEITRLQKLKEDEDAAKAAIRESEKGLQLMRDEQKRLRDKFGKGEELSLNLINKGYNVDPVSTRVEKYIELTNKLTKAEQQHATQVHILNEAQQRLIGYRRENGALADEQAKKARARASGTGLVGEDGTGSGNESNQAYLAAIERFNTDIARAYNESRDERRKAESEFRQGKIGSLELVNRIADAEAAAYKKVDAAIQGQIALASKSAKTKADLARFSGDATIAQDRAEQAAEMRRLRAGEVESNALAAASRAKVKRLIDEKDYAAAAEEKWSFANSKAFADAELNAEHYGGVYKDVLDEMKAARQAAIDEGVLKGLMGEFETQAIRTANTLKGFKAATQGSGIGEMWESAQEASANYREEMSKLRAMQKKLNDEAKNGGKAQVQAAEEGLNRMKGLADKHRNMWVEVGETITKSLGDAFGSAGEAAGRMFAIQADYDQNEKKTYESRMGYYGQMTQAASGFFDKSSKGYKTLNTVAQAFHALEMARTVVRSAQLAIEAVLTQGKGDPYTAWARMAAMAAVVAGLGYAVGGFGGKGKGPSSEERQASQGTGSVFGDSKAKSESITKSLEILKANSDVMLPLTQMMANSLQNIEASMTGFASLLIRGIDPASQFQGSYGSAGGKVNKFGTALDLMFGGGFATTLDKLTGGFLSKASAKISNTIFGGKKSLEDSGVTANAVTFANLNALNAMSYQDIKRDGGMFHRDKYPTYTESLGAEANAQITQIIRDMGNALTLASNAFGLDANVFKKKLDSFVVKIGEISLKGLSAEEQQKQISAVFSKIFDDMASFSLGGLQQFQKVGEGYAETVIRVASGIEQAKLATEQLGIAAIAYTDIINKQGDVAVEMVKQSIGKAEGLSGINTIIQGMTGNVKDLVEMYKSLDSIRKKMNLVNLNGSGLNLSVIKGAGGVSELNSALDTYKDKYFTEQEKSGIMLRSVTAEFSKLGLALPTSKAALRALIEQTGVSTEANAKLTGQLLALSGAYSDLIDAQNAAIEKAKSGIESLIDQLKEFANTIRDFKNSLLLGNLSTLNPVEKYAEAKRQYEQTVAKAMLGDVTAQGNVTSAAQAYLEASRVINASDANYTASFEQVMADMNRLESYTGYQLTAAEQQLEVLRQQADSLQALNATATGILTGVENLSVAPAAPAPQSPAPTSQDTSEVVEELAKLREEFAEANAKHQAQMIELMNVIINSNDQAADKVVDGVSDAMDSQAWTTNNGKVITER